MPDTSIGYVMKGHVLCNKGDFDKAIQEITEAKDFGRIKEVDYPLAYTVRGWAHLNKKSPEAALVDFDEALRLNADLAIALAFRADVHRQKRDYKKAEADLKKAIKLQPENSLVYAQFAMYYDDLNVLRRS